MKGYGLKALTLNLHKGFVGLWKNLRNVSVLKHIVNKIVDIYNLCYSYSILLMLSCNLLEII